METNLSFWWDLENFSQKSVPSHTFLRCGDYLKFLRGLGKFRQKDVPSYTFFSLWRLTWVFEGTLKVSAKRCAQLHVFFRCGDYLKFLRGLGMFRQKDVPSYTFFFAVETNLSFWRDSEKFSQKSVPSHMFLRCGDYLKFLMGLKKISTKRCAQLHVFSLWRLTWVFQGTLKVSAKRCDQLHIFFRSADYLKILMGLGKFRQKGVPSYTFFFRCGDYLKFLRGLGMFRQKDVPSYTFFSLWRLTWVFDGTWKNFHKKACPVTRFFAVETILSFWGDLESFDKKMCPVTRFFSLWRLTWIFEGTRKIFHKKVCPVICFFAVETILSFWWGLKKFPQKFVPSYTFFSLWRLS